MIDLIYKYIRGSRLYNLNTENSDIDYSGIFVEDIDELLGLGFNYRREISDEKHDLVYYEIGVYMKLLLKSNPTILESLFIPQDKILIDSPEINEIRGYRDELVTKSCFNAFCGYSSSRLTTLHNIPEDTTYDSKDIMHSFRLIAMCTEVANGDGFNVVRTKDHDFLMDVRNNKFTRSEITKLLKEKIDEMESAMKTSKIKDKIDENLINSILLKIRKDRM